MEKIPGEASYIRHSSSNYETYIKQAQRGDKGFDSNDQEYPDLNEKGINLAQEKAKEFFENLDPEKDILFFASSNEARALATAEIYRQEAIKRGFEIIKPEKTNLKLSDEKTDGYVRISNMLSLNIDDYTEQDIFVPDLPQKVIDDIANSMDEEERENWLEARKIIDNAPEEVKKKGFGEIYFKYADELKKYLPNIRGAKEVEKRFKNILRLAEWGLKKGQESGLEKNLKILGFSHENYVIFILDKYFKDRAMKNCDCLKIESLGKDNFRLSKDGEDVEMQM